MAEYNMPQYILREFKVTDARVRHTDNTNSSEDWKAMYEIYSTNMYLYTIRHTIHCVEIRRNCCLSWYTLIQHIRKPHTHIHTYITLETAQTHTHTHTQKNMHTQKHLHTLCLISKLIYYSQHKYTHSCSHRDTRSQHILFILYFVTRIQTHTH